MTKPRRELSLHTLGVVCGLAAGVWLGAAEAPTKLVTTGLSPLAVSLCMVAGVFTARWSVPTLMKGTAYVLRDLRVCRHLIVWAILAGALWAVANTLTVFAVRDVGLAIAFPLWNANSLIGLLWGRLLFGELEGAKWPTVVRVVLGAVCIVVAAILLGFSTMHGGGGSGRHATAGILAAVGASLLWGTMYVPYRKAYLSGLNPLSFVTVFTVGELGTMLVLTLSLEGGFRSTAAQLAGSGRLLFWLFLGGFVWVIGDLFQQFATKYLGIGRGIPLSNTNQLWGLAWAALVFGELRGATRQQAVLVLGGSVIMVAGAALIASATSSGREQTSRDLALERECTRYGIDYRQALLAQAGVDPDRHHGETGRRWWDFLLVSAAVLVFAAFAVRAVVPPLRMDLRWVAVLGFILVASALGAGLALQRRTRFG